LNEKEESEVAYDWSERNSSVARKKSYHAVSRLRLAQVPALDLKSLPYF
jgi:dystonin